VNLGTRLTDTQRAALEVIVSFCWDPDRIFVRDVASELGFVYDTALRAVTTLRKRELVSAYSLRLTPDAWNKKAPPCLKRVARFIADNEGTGRRLTYIEVAREFRWGANAASARLSEMRQAGMLEPRFSLWPTQAGIDRVSIRRAS
jgi:hypothetical protein